MVLYNAAIVTQSASPCATAWPKIWGLISTGLDWGGCGGGWRENKGGTFTTRATCSGFAAQAFHSNITFLETTCSKIQFVLKSDSAHVQSSTKKRRKKHKKCLELVASLLLLTYAHLVIGFFVYPPCTLYNSILSYTSILFLTCFLVHLPSPPSQKMQNLPKTNMQRPF